MALGAVTLVLAVGVWWRAGSWPTAGDGTPVLASYADALTLRGVDAAAWLPLTVILAWIVLAVTWLLARADGRRPWAAMAWAVAPVLALHWFSWDLLPAAGVAFAAWAALRGRPALAGAAVGAAAALNLIVLPVVLGLALAPPRARARITLAAVAVAAAVVTALPWLLTDRSGDWLAVGTGSLWLLAAQASDTALPGPLVVGATAGSLALVVLLVARRIDRHRTGTLPSDALRPALLAALAALVVLPSVPPQAALVVLPLAALVVRRWRDLLVWQACEVFAWTLTRWYDAGWLAPSAGGDSSVYWLAICVRVAGVLWLAGAVTAHARRWSGPDEAVRSGHHDVVERGGGVADPDVDLLADGRHSGT